MQPSFLKYLPEQPICPHKRLFNKKDMEDIIKAGEFKLASKKQCYQFNEKISYVCRHFLSQLKINITSIPTKKEHKLLQDYRKLMKQIYFSPPFTHDFKLRIKEAFKKLNLEAKAKNDKHEFLSSEHFYKHAVNIQKSAEWILDKLDRVEYPKSIQKKCKGRPNRDYSSPSYRFDFVKALAEIYTEYTGKYPTRGTHAKRSDYETPFTRFVDTVIKIIKPEQIDPKLKKWTPEREMKVVIRTISPK